MARTDGRGTGFYHADGDGNVSLLVDGAGDVLARYLYDPFGQLLGMWGPLAQANVYRFSSKPMDVWTGAYDFGYRDYQPNLQRWLSRDPLQERGGVNLYGYVGNNSISKVDRNGLQAEEAEFEPDNGYDFFGNETVFGADGNGYDSENTTYEGSAGGGYGETYYPPEDFGIVPMQIMPPPDGSLQFTGASLMDNLNDYKELLEFQKQQQEIDNLETSIAAEQLSQMNMSGSCPPKKSTPNSVPPSIRSPSYQSSPSYQYGY